MSKAILIRQRETRPKKYGKPRELSLKAMGMLYHLLLHLDSDGNYSWGNVKTAGHFGVHYNRIAEVLEELIDNGYVINMQSGKDPQTGKNRLQIVRPTAKTLKPRTPACTGNDTPHTPVRVEPTPEKQRASLLDAAKQQFINESTHASAPLSVITTNTVNEPVSTGCNSVGNVDEMHARVRGLQANLKEEQDELQTWERFGNKNGAETCRRRISELQAKILEVQR